MSTIKRSDALNLISGFISGKETLKGFDTEIDRDALTVDLLKVLAEHLEIQDVIQTGNFPGTLSISSVRNMDGTPAEHSLEKMVKESKFTQSAEIRCIDMEDRSLAKPNELYEMELNVRNSQDDVIHLSLIPSYFNTDPIYANCIADGLHMRIEVANGSPSIAIARNENMDGMVVKIPYDQAGFQLDYDENGRSKMLTLGQEQDHLYDNRLKIAAALVEDMQFEHNATLEDWNTDELVDDIYYINLFFKNPDSDSDSIKGQLKARFFEHSAMLISYEVDYGHLPELLNEDEDFPDNTLSAIPKP